MLIILTFFISLITTVCVYKMGFNDGKKHRKIMTGYQTEANQILTFDGKDNK